ncbi:MAG: invasin domain 3-containing protein, partial [Pseudomonadota bacterium]
PANLSADGSSLSTIRALVTDAQGNAVDNETISFTIVPPGGGRLISSTGATADGVAEVSYEAGEAAGTVTIRAASTNGVVQTTTITLVSAIISSVDLTAGAGSIVADGASSVLLTARVVDSVGGPVANGTLVTFTTTAGFVNAYTATVPGALTSFSAPSSGGVAQALLFSPQLVGTAMVTATVGGISDSTQVNFIPGPVHDLTLSVSPSNLTADGASQSTLRAEVRDEFGNAVNNFETISFTVVSGTGLIQPATDFTQDGIAASTYTAGTTPGTVTVRASSTNGITDTATITLVEAQVGQVNVTAGADSIPADGVSKVAITATVFTDGGAPVPEGTLVTFNTTAGSVAAYTALASGGLTAFNAPTVNGVARVMLFSSQLVGQALVSATAGGIIDDVTVRFVAGAPNQVVLTTQKEFLPADGVSTMELYAQVTDAMGNAVANGEVVSFTVVSGPGTIVAPAVQVFNGRATATYRAGTTAGAVTLRAETTNRKFGTAAITLLPTTIASVDVTAEAAEIQVGGQTPVLIRAMVLDSADNPVPDGTQVTFNTTAGLLGVYTAVAGSATSISVPTVNGEALVLLFSGNSVGTATIYGSAGGVVDSATVNFVQGAVAKIVVTMTPSSLRADNTSTSNVVVRVQDAFGNPVQNETISFVLNMGTILQSTTASTPNGFVFATYTAGGTPGNYSLTAKAANSVSGQAFYALIGEEVGSVTVEPGKSQLVADGTSNTQISATVRDTSGDLVDGVTVTFTNQTAYGTLSGNSAVTVNGRASVILTSPTKSGNTALIRADSGGLSGNATVVFIPGPVFRIVADANPTTVPAAYTLCPNDTGRVVVTVLDAFNNPVADGTIIDFAINKGWIWADYPLCPDPPTKPLTVASSKSLPSANGSASIGLVGAGFVEVGRVSVCAGGVCYVDENGDRGVKISFGGAAGDSLGLPAAVELAVLSNFIQIKGTGGTQNTVIWATVLDEQGNPIQDSYQAGNGTTVNGSNVFTSATAQFQSRGFNAGDSLVISSGANNGTYTITGFGADPETQVTLDRAFTRDYNQEVYFTARIKGNITFSILTGPGGGENLEGAQSVVKSTTDGQAFANLNSGVLPGTVTLRVTATQGAGTASSTSSQIGIYSGPPALISLYSGTTESSTGGGINVRDFFALVQDRFGNAVPSGTAVSFGLVDNVKTSGTDGVAVTPHTFQSASAGFNTNSVDPTDTLVVTGGTPRNRGGFIIETVDSDTQVTLYRTLYDAGTGLNFLAGDALYGLVDALGWTGQDDLPGVAVVGVAYPRLAAGNKSMTLYAMTTGFDVASNNYNLGATLSGTYALSSQVGYVSMNVGVKSLVADEVDSTPILVQVLDSNFEVVPDGTEVTFRTTAGTLSTYTATTSQGVAMVTLTSGRTVGSATVTAIAGGVSAQDTVSFVAGPVWDVLLAALPANLSADGVSTSTIRATAVDAKGNRVSGEPLSFTVVSGTLSAASATTNINGEATVTYTAPGQVPGGGASATDTVGVISTNQKAKTVNIVLNAASVGTVTISAGSSSIVADKAHTSQIFARVLNAGGGLVQDGTVVTFSTTAGTVTPYTATAPGLVRTLTATTINGEATVSLWSSIYVGTAAVTATAGGRTASTTVDFIPGEPAELQLRANPASLPSDGKSTSSITVTVRDLNGNPVADGEIINFRVTLGSLSSLTSATTGGIASVTYTSPATGESDTITATATNGVAADPVNIVLIGPAIAGVILSADPDSLPANGTAQAQITATVSLEGGGPAPDGTEVKFSIANSGGGNIEPTSTTANGVAKVLLTAGPSPEVVTIRASVGSLVEELEFSYKSGDVKLEVVPNSILATGLETAKVRVTVKSSSGAFQAYSPVTFTLSDESMGTISPRTAITNGVGYTEVIFTGGTTGGEVRITATWIGGAGDSVTGVATLQIQPPPAFLSVAKDSPAPPGINVRGTGGVSTSLITFDVKDGQNLEQQVADGYRIDFEISTGPDGGEAIVPLYAYTKNGQVSTVLKSGFLSGAVTVKASYFNDRNVNAVASLVINAGPPVGEEFSIFPTFRNMSGLSYSNLANVVHVNVGDVNGNGVPDGTSIYFNTNNTGGLFAQGNGQTVLGGTSDTLRSTTGPDPIQGFLSVNAEANNGGRTTHVTSLAVVPGGDILYAATNGGGVYKSLDGGASWVNQSISQTIVAQNWIDPYVNAVAIDPDDPNRVLAGTGYAGQGSVYRSFDGGHRWNSDNDEEITGMFSLSGAVYCILVDDDGNSNTGDGEYMWIGTQGNGLIYTTDFSQTPSWDMTFNSPVTADMGVGRTVFALAKSPSALGGDGVGPNTAANAILYAGTPRGVYRTQDGGVNWAALPAFLGNSIATLKVHNDAGIGDVVYAGTSDAGVWVYANGGWTNYTTGLGKAVQATDPVLARESKGNGYIDNLDVLDGARSETWIMKCISEIANSGIFALTGTVSGFQGNYTVTDQNGPLYQVGNLIEFTLVDGEVDFKMGDTFSFKTVRDLGKNITDLAVDMSRQKLYAITYFWGPLEAHAIGDVYVHELEVDGTMAAGAWKTVNVNLPQHEPPDDTSLFP